MIPPGDGRPMTGPPPWYDEVIDLSLDEATGLLEMGVRVYMDYASSDDGIAWYSSPTRAYRVSAASNVMASADNTRLYFIPKDSSDDPTN